MSDRIRSASDAPAGLLTVLARSGGRLPVGGYRDARGVERKVHHATAAALVKRGYARYEGGHVGRRWIVITDSGKAAREYLFDSDGPPMPRKPKAPSQRARDMAARTPDLAPAAIAAKVGITRQGVEAALSRKRGGKRGRPGEDSRTVRLSSKLLDAAEAFAEHDGVSLRAWIEAAIRDRFAGRTLVTR